uniref:Uncharacterized protein n=1 Tax=Arundo donax TaxID=35708 RepID=A0A0A9AXI8_ARUDO
MTTKHVHVSPQLGLITVLFKKTQEVAYLRKALEHKTL